MKLELVPKLAQQQTLSPKMLLSMKVLPLTNMELEHQLAQEVVENPALELAQASPDQAESVQKIDTLSSSLRLFQPYQDAPPHCQQQLLCLQLMSGSRVSTLRQPNQAYGRRGHPSYRNRNPTSNAIPSDDSSYDRVALMPGR